MAAEVILLVLASAICSGLNIAVMSLDVSDLRRKAKLGNRQAKQVLAASATHSFNSCEHTTNECCRRVGDIINTQSAPQWLVSGTSEHATHCCFW